MNSLSSQDSELESIFRIAIESSHNHTIITDINANIIYANTAAVEATGYTIEEMMGQNPRLWGHRMPLRFYEKLWDTIKSEKKPFKGEIHNCKKDGTLFTVLATISPIFRQNGEFIGFICTEENITSIKATENSLKVKSDQLSLALSSIQEKNKTLEQTKLAMLNLLEDAKDLEGQIKREKDSVEEKVNQRTTELGEEKARMMAAISSLPQAFLIVDVNNQIVVYNSRLSSILGSSSGVWTLKKVNDSLGESINIEEEVSQSTKNRKVMKGKEVRVGAKYLEVYISPVLPGIYSETNDVVGSVITITDVTEARLLERSHEEFFTIASHELRTPLTAIRGNTSMILDYFETSLDPKVKEMVEDAHTSSVRLISIVNDFLNMSRLEQGRMEYTKSDLLLQDIFNKVIQNFESIKQEKKVEIQLEVADTIKVFADPGKVEQIAINLIGNALKFTTNGTITISAARVANTVKIIFTDTGVGIPLANQTLLFRKFQQAGTSTITRDNPQGTGLGLYISRLMTEGMGGTLVLVRSEEGKGTEFCLTLPSGSLDTK